MGAASQLRLRPGPRDRELPERRRRAAARSGARSCTRRRRARRATTPIARRDNIPVISYLLLRGRCRNCSAAIAWRYPAVELVTAGLIVACFVAFGLTAEAVVAVVLLRRARRHLGDRHRALHHPEPDRAPRRRRSSSSRRRRSTRRPNGCSPGSAPRPSSSSPRSPIRAGWGWATSSSRSCSASCSGAPCRSRSSSR